MDSSSDLVQPLLQGLPLADQIVLLQRLDSARNEQLLRKRNPARRRHRNAAGELVLPPSDQTRPVRTLPVE